MESKNKSLGTTMVDLVNIVSPEWSVPSDNLNEVFPGIYLGDEFAAKNVDLLKQTKITHILNAAYSEKHSFLYVNTSQSFYRDQNFECIFLGLSAVDCPTYKLAKYFQQAGDFIDSALSCPEGKILVHCRQGVSRSATFVIIYLMIKKKMTAREAVAFVRERRNIFPNKGFLKEVCDLENQLVKAKHYATSVEMLYNVNSAVLIFSSEKLESHAVNNDTEFKYKSLGATMVDLANIVTPGWTVPSDNLNEVFPGIYLGDEFAAKNVDLLKQMKMTHILNAAYSEKNSFLYVNTSQSFYRDSKFECIFMGLSAVDCPTYKLAKYFQQATDFIDSAVSCPEGKILVHCRQGVSRSATFVIIYLMIKKKMTGREAVALVRTYRNIFPNQGFLKEVCDLENQLVKAKHYDTSVEMLDNVNSALM